MAINDPALLRTARAYAKQQYEKDMVQATTAPGGLEAIGAPHWNRDAWEQFKIAYGRYPSFREGDLPNLEGCPDWAFELMQMRPPPVSVTTGSRQQRPGDVVYPEGTNKLTIWDVK